MTLVLTKVTRDGIAMAADAALSESFAGYGRVLIGASKLLPHLPSSTCVGTWGEALLPNPRPDAFPVPVEFVLRTFLDTARSITSADQLSAKLADWLNETYPRARRVAGIDVASVRAAPSGAHPVVYRVMNADRVDADATAHFRRTVIRPPAPFHAEDDAPILTAGDINADFWVDDISAAMRRAAFKTRTRLPDDVEGVAAWLAVIVRSVSDLYSNLKIGGSIGGPVSTVIIRQGDGTIDERRRDRPVN